MLSRVSVAGLTESGAKLTREAQDYWRTPSGENWKSNSHWRDADAFAENDLWSEVGRGHLELFDRLAQVCGEPPRFGTVLEWGCGGGANAVHFAPRSSRFVGVEISQPSLDECARQVEATCATPFVPILIDGDDPESVVDRLDGTCDVFLCFYVFELIPSPEYDARLLGIAERVLGDGGVALIQFKYETGAFLTRPRRRDYRRDPAAMTTYRIEAFWTLAQHCGLQPQVLHLVPRNELDERYAYLLLTKPTHVGR